jgi:6,7-dimethyl-8-ribityllumazine synthase
MSSKNQNLSSKKIVNTSGIDYFRLGVVVAEWNQHITGKLFDGCLQTLLDNGVKKEHIFKIDVPGSFELISGAKILIEKSIFDAIICIGCVIRGDTPHFDYVCQGVTQGIAYLNAQQDISVIYGLLTVDNEQQALDRCGGIHGNKGDEAAFTALKMINLKKNI